MIYKLGYDFQNTAILSIDGVELVKKMPTLRPRFFAQPKQQVWVAPEARFYYSENFTGTNGTTPDITTWSTGVLAFSPKATALFQDSLKNTGEFLPLLINNETYYLFNTLYVIPEHAINKDKAVDVIDSGVHFGQSNVTFDESFLDSENVMLFKSNTDKLLNSFCTSKFKRMYEANGFKGLIFDKVELV